MKYILQEKFNLFEGAESDTIENIVASMPDALKPGGKINWAKVFSISHPIKTGSNAYELAPVSSLWEVFFSNTYFQEATGCAVGSGQLAKQLKDVGLTQELLELGFNMSTNPFLKFLNDTWFNDPGAYSAMPKCYAALHNLYVDSSKYIKDRHLTATNGGESMWQSLLIHNSNLYKGNFTASEVYSLIEYLANTVANSYDGLQYKSPELKDDNKPSLLQLLGFIVCGTSEIAADIKLDAFNNTAALLKDGTTINDKKTINTRFYQLVERDSIKEASKEASGDTKAFTAALTTAVFDGTAPVKTDPRLKAVLKLIAQRYATSEAEFNSMTDAIKEAYKGLTIDDVDDDIIVDLTKRILKMKFRATATNITEFCEKLT